MKEIVSRWFKDQARFRGVLAGGVRFTDRTCFSQSFATGYPVAAVENVLRCVADTFQVLQLHRMKASRLRWAYANGCLHCARREDGTFIALFTSLPLDAVDLEGLDQRLAEFQQLGAVNE